jgi:hypothetical protein
MTVLLSTSSFSPAMTNSCYARAPSGPWLRTLLLLFVIFAVGLLSLEMFWRWQGHVPGVSDSMGLWSQQRELISADPNDPKMVVLIGASRMQLGFNTSVFKARYPEHRLVNLSIDGTAPLGVLRDLAADENFSGLVIADVTAPQFERTLWDQTNPHTEFYHHTYRPSPDRQINVALELFLQSHLALFQDNLSLRSLIKAVVTRELPKPFYLTTLPDRSRLADYSKMADVAAHRAERLRRIREIEAARRPVPFETWLADVRQVGAWVKAIEARGGRVMFVRLPTSGEHWELDEATYPRSIYWDVLARETGAPNFHFTDSPEMAAIELPDTSHMDAKDTPRFTELLLDQVQKAGLLPALR